MGGVGFIRLVTAFVVGWVALASTILVAPAALASPGDVIWTRQFGTSDLDSASGVAAGPDGSIYVVGDTVGALPDSGGSQGSRDAFIRRYSASGAVLWSRQFGSGGVDHALAVAVGLDGSAYVVGLASGDLVEGGHDGATDGFVRKYSASGNVQWTRHIGTGVFDRATAVAVGPDGGVYVAGYTDGDLVADANAGGTDAYLRKFAPVSGFVLWTRQWGTSSTDTALSVAVGPEGSVVVAGRTNGILPDGGGLQGLSDAYIKMYTSSGDVVWTRQFGTVQPDEARSVAVGPDGGILVVGSSAGELPGGGGFLGGVDSGDAFLRKYSALGDVLWTRQFGTSSADSAMSVAVGPHGGVYVAGFTWGALPGGGGKIGAEDAFARSYSASGDVMWTRQFGTGSEDRANSVAVGSGRVYLAGRSFGALPDGGGSLGSEDAFVMVLDDPSVVRYAGANRFETAGEISAWDFPRPAWVDTVFVAVGSNFPDALAGAAAAGSLGAPLLLVNTTSIPDVTAAELSRMDPDLIVVLGGTSVISPGVEAALGAWGTVERWAGSNRYATAATISSETFGDPSAVDEVIVATGVNFPDALGGGPVAVAVGGPVLLVPPTGSIPAEVAAELTRLDPLRITVLGGESAVSSGMFSQLSAFADTITRKSGSNRYATAIEASKHGFGSAGRVYVAVGTNFPDALAGAAAAGVYDAPVLLVPSATLPGEVSAEITRLGAHTVIILGGTGVVSVAVENGLKTLLGV